MTTALESDEIMFSPESYRLEVRSIDGYRAAKCSLRFGGSGSIDRTSADDVELMKAARMGSEVRLIVVGTVATKSYSLPKNGEEIAYAFVVRVESVEALDAA
jgi:hypothetical protein